MSSSKKELIDEIVRLLLTEFEPYRITAGDRNFLEQSTVTYLENKLQQLQNESAARGPVDPLAKEREALRQTKEATNRAKAKLQIHQYSGLTNAQVNDSLLDELLPGPSLSFENFRSLIEQNPQFQDRFEWDSVPFGRVKAAEAEQSNQRTKVRQAFSAAALAVTAHGLNDVGDFDANFGRVCSVLGTDFTVAQAVKALTNGSIQGLAPSVNAAELRAAYQQKQIEDHNKALMNATSEQLKAVVRQDAAESRRNSSQEQFDRELLAAYERDVVYGGKSPLPTEFQGKPLDSHFIKTCPADVQRRLTARYGSAQLTARAHGITKIGKYEIQ
jgi:hypothetical protein